ncbi:BTAD domain-containing putative transcriptional regulator [Aquihabitans sp. McL0605]|uniref:BTAD domain-containing putative transcriptional regulator n=1 Tax=Aquihabitans sp. McL0605 TaxID=3415671 RepID=UPI003CF30002
MSDRATPPTLVVSLLGPVRAWRDGEPAALGGRRQRAVLVRLALSGGDPVAVDRLVDDLWSGEPPPSAISSLQSYLSNLRKALGADLQPIERIGDAYRLQLPQGALDTDRFAALLDLAADADDDQERLALLDEALALWQGRAIADFADEPWARGDVVRLEQHRLAAQHDRFALLLDLGRHALAAGEIEAALAEHPLHEAFAAQLVLALYRGGRQAEALRAFERMRATLADELGLAPGPELARLADQVLAQDPALAAPTPAEPSTPPPSADAGAAATDDADTDEAEESAESPLPLPPAVAERRTRSAFVGRTAERTVLDRAWEAAMAGERHLLVVSGEAGVGKTRLTQETARGLHARGAYVLWGRCTPEHLIAYQPIVESLRTALRSLPVERVRELVEPRPPLGLLLPELAEGVDLPARTGRFELYEALADLLAEVTLATPMLLVIDDLQWADPSTLTLLDQVLANPRGGRVLIVATMRRPAGRPTPEVDRFLAEARRAQRFTSIDLEGLDRGAASELLHERGVAMAGAELDAILDRTAGNPLFIEALADPTDTASLTDARELPATVRDLFDQRYRAVDDRTAAVTVAAAVIGQRVDIELLGAVTDLDQASLLDVLDEAIDAGLLAEDEDIGWVTFPHALVRQSLIARTTRNREARLHVTVADALEARPSAPDHATTVAQHLFAAGRACPAERASAAAVAAGRRALEVVADEEALIWSRRAVDALAATDKSTPTWQRARAEALLLLGETQRLLGQLDDARSALTSVMDLARRQHDAAVLARAAQQWALASGAIGFSFGGLDDELIALIDEARSAIGPDDHAERAALLAWSSLALNPGDDRDGQDRLSIEALEAAAEVPGNAHIQALTLFARHMAVGGPAGLDERLSLLAPLRTAARGWSELEVLARALAVVDLLEADRVAQADAALEELRAFVEPIHRPALDTFVAFFDAMWALLRGDLARADERSTHALTIGTDAHGENAATAWAGQQFLIALERGQLPALIDELAGLVDDQPLVPVWGIGLARSLVASGEPERAIEMAHRYLGDGGLTVHPRSVLRYLVAALAAEVCWLTGDPLLAEHLLVELAPISHRVGVAGLAAASVGHLVRHHGLVLAVAGDLDAADGLLDVAVASAAAAGFDVARAHALAERAVVLRRRGHTGDQAEADRCAAEAEALAADLGVVLELPAD